MALKENDFVAITYTGKVKDDGHVFDTTDENVAKEHELGDKGPFGPQTICIGQGFTLRGLEKKLMGKGKGKHTIELAPEEGFGKKSAKLIRLFNAKKFIDQQVLPQPGVVVNIDNHIGIIKTVTGGRCLVDFNHPLAGKVLIYDVEIHDIITDVAANVKTYVKHVLGESVGVDVKDDKATLTTPQELPKPLADEFKKRIMDVTQAKDVTFVTKGSPKTSEPAEAKPAEQ